MFVQLRFQPSPEAPPGDAFHLLLECHARIRSFTALALRLARLEDVPAPERREAATRVERYFAVGLPRHVEDEDLSLAPRLREAGLSAEALQALDTMTRQHQDIEALLGTLLPAWRVLCASPERHAALAPELVEGSVRLAELMEQHLQLEENVLFPEARARLPVESVAAIAAEMCQRRGPRS